MFRRPPRSTRTYTPVPYTPLSRSRGPVHAHAARLEAEGHRILKLNIGNPAPFGFDAPDVIMRDMIAALPYAQGYSESKGILSARRAIVTRYELVRSEEHTSELQSLMRNSYAVFCLKKKKTS